MKQNVHQPLPAGSPDSSPRPELEAAGIQSICLKQTGTEHAQWRQRDGQRVKALRAVPSHPPTARRVIRRASTRLLHICTTQTRNRRSTTRLIDRSGSVRDVDPSNVPSGSAAVSAKTGRISRRPDLSEGSNAHARTHRQAQDFSTRVYSQ